MFKAMGHLARFADGLGVNMCVNPHGSFWYIKDVLGTERIGEVQYQPNMPELKFRDITSGRMLKFEADYMVIDKGYPFMWFPSIKRAAILHDDFNNPVQRTAMLFYELRDFISAEFIFESANGSAANRYLGERAQCALTENALTYANSIEMAYASLLKQKDFAELFKNREYDKIMLADNELKFSGADNLGLLFYHNRDLMRELIKAGDTTKNPDELVESFLRGEEKWAVMRGYTEFLAAYNCRANMARLREENPPETLMEKVKNVDSRVPFVVSFRQYESELSLQQLNAAQ